MEDQCNDHCHYAVYKPRKLFSGDCPWDDLDDHFPGGKCGAFYHAEEG